MSYDRRLEYFNLERLELRRVHFDQLNCIKSLIGLSTLFLTCIVHYNFVILLLITHVVIALNLLSIVPVLICVKIIL
jgi:hypothetical protein